MKVERRPVIAEACVEQCAMARICHGIDPVKAVTLAMDLTNRPYGGCHSADGPIINPNGERCHLDPDVQVALTGIATGMALQAGKSLVAAGPFDESTGRMSEVEITKSPAPIPVVAGQSMGYMR